jgi:hypothetical protein
METGTALRCWITLAGSGRGRDLGWAWRRGWTPFLGRHRVGEETVGNASPFEFSMFLFSISYAYARSSDFSVFLTYITPPSLISFSYPYCHYKLSTYLCVKSSSLYNLFFSVLCMIWYLTNSSHGSVLARPPISYCKAGHERGDGEYMPKRSLRCPSA